MGQRISALDRLYLAEKMPSMVIHGERDQIIPATHAEIAHEAMPGSRLEILPGAGHFPQLAEPMKIARLLSDFIDETEAAEVEAEDMRDLVLNRMAEDAA